MNKTEQRMLDVLKELKDEYGVLAVKAEFEAEGSRTDELVMLNEVVFRADMRLIIKIGGCEAIRDLDQCRILGASGIMAPMIETPYAMEKFREAAGKVYAGRMDTIEWIINAETVTCLDNIDAILRNGSGFLNTIAIGRVDLAGSAGLGRKDINGDTMFGMAGKFARTAREFGLVVGIGGGISFDAIPFIREMRSLIDKFETRKIVFSATDNEKLLRSGILKAMEFEMLYLQNKCSFYDRMANEDRTRMEMLQARLKKAKEEME